MLTSFSSLHYLKCIRPFGGQKTALLMSFGSKDINCMVCCLCDQWKLLLIELTAAVQVKWINMVSKQF